MRSASSARCRSRSATSCRSGSEAEQRRRLAALGHRLDPVDDRARVELVELRAVAPVVFGGVDIAPPSSGLKLADAAIAGRHVARHAAAGADADEGRRQRDEPRAGEQFHVKILSMLSRAAEVLSAALLWVKACRRISSTSTQAEVKRGLCAQKLTYPANKLFNGLPGLAGPAMTRELLRRSCGLRQVVERRDDVLGQRIGQRIALVRIAHQPDAAGRQLGEAVRGREHAHAGPQSRFREHRYGKPRQHRGADRARIAAGIEHAIRPPDALEAFDRGAAPVAGRAAERERQALLDMRRVAVRGRPQQPLLAEILRRHVAGAIGDDREIELVALMRSSRQIVSSQITVSSIAG